MLAFNQKIITRINDRVSNGKTVVVKLKPDTPPKEIVKKKVDSVTSGSFETKMHFVQSQIAAQKATIKKDR